MNCGGCRTQAEGADPPVAGQTAVGQAVVDQAVNGQAFIDHAGGVTFPDSSAIELDFRARPAGVLDVARVLSEFLAVVRIVTLLLISGFHTVFS